MVSCHVASVNRSQLDCSFLIFGYRFEKAGVKSKGNRKKTKDEVRNEFVRSALESVVFENEKLDQRPEKARNDEEAIPVVRK